MAQHEIALAQNYGHVLPYGLRIIRRTIHLHIQKSNEKHISEAGLVGVKKTGKGRRKIGRKKRRMRARIRHRKK